MSFCWKVVIDDVAVVFAVEEGWWLWWWWEEKRVGLWWLWWWGLNGFGTCKFEIGFDKVSIFLFFLG